MKQSDTDTATVVTQTLRLEVVSDPGEVFVHPCVHSGEVWSAALHSKTCDAHNTPSVTFICVNKDMIP